MASNKLLMLTIVAIFLPAMTIATDYIVGDDSGWTTNFDYQAWAKDKVFYVGDKLVFKYFQGYHNVFKVNGTAFKNCDVPVASQPLTSGNDTIVLMTPGRKWYICGVANHCASYGQKLFITVQYQYWAPAPSPNPEPWTPAPTTEPWAPAPSPIPEVPWTPTPTTEPWEPVPIPSPAPTPSSIDVPWWPLSPSPSPYPWN